MLKNQEWILTLYDHLIDHEVANHKVVPRTRSMNASTDSTTTGSGTGASNADRAAARLAALCEDPSKP